MRSNKGNELVNTGNKNGEKQLNNRRWENTWNSKTDYLNIA